MKGKAWSARSATLRIKISVKPKPFSSTTTAALAPEKGGDERGCWQDPLLWRVGKGKKLNEQPVRCSFTM